MVRRKVEVPCQDLVRRGVDTGYRGHLERLADLTEQCFRWDLLLLRDEPAVPVDGDPPVREQNAHEMPCLF